MTEYDEDSWQAGFQAGQESVGDQRAEAWREGYGQGRKDALAEASGWAAKGWSWTERAGA